MRYSAEGIYYPTSVERTENSGGILASECTGSVAYFVS